MQPNTSLPRVCPTSDVAGALCTNLISRILTYRLAEVNRPVPGVSRFFACARACQRGRALLSLFWRGSCASNRRAESVLPRLRHADPAADAGSSRRTRRLRAVPALSSLRMLATAQGSLPCGPRIGLASGLRGDPRPPPQGQRRERKRCPFLRRFGYNTRCQENKQKKGQHCE